MAFISAAQRNRAADAVCARANGGSLAFYGGPVPADADAVLSSNPVLAVLGMSATAFQPANNGVAVANTITADASADNTGVATFARVLETGGTSVVMQLSVGTSGSDVILSSVQVVQGGPVSISSLTYTQAKGS